LVPGQSQLIGRRLHSNGTLSPLGVLRPSNPGQSIVIFQSGIAQRINLNDSFYFELPDVPQDWRQGTIELEFQGISHSFSCGNPNSDDCRKVRVAFKSPRYVDVRLVGITWKENGNLREPSQDDFEKAAHQIEATFPVTRVNRDHPYNIAPSFLNGRPPKTYNDFVKLLAELSAHQKNDGCNPFPQGNCNVHYLGIILLPTGAAAPPTDSQVGLSSRPGSVAAAYLTPFFSVPHELAHNFGRKDLARCFVDLIVSDPNY